MKICITADNGSVHIQKWIQAIAGISGIELHVICFDRGIKYPNVSYHFLKRSTGTKLDYILNISKFRLFLSEIKPDLLHAHYATSYGFLAAFSGFHPLVITGWGADIFDSPQNILMGNLLKYSFKKADALTVLSKVTQREMLKLTDKKVELIPFGVDLNKFVPAKNKTDNKIHIGTIRTLSEKYGVEYLVRAFAELRSRHSTIHLDIVGDGPQREFLKNLANELKISDSVTFHGFVNQNNEFERYIKLLNSFDIFAILSVLDSETFGVAAVEASACKIPVVATNVGGLPEVIDNENTGILVEPRNVKQTAAAIERLIKDAELRNKMGENGRKKVETEYNWQKNVEQMVELYKREINKAGK